MEAVMRHLSNQRGIALIAALCISIVLMIFAFALVYRMATFLRMLATAREKNQSYYTAVAGTEQLRDRLRGGSCRPPDWCGLIGFAGNPTKAEYRDVTLFAVLQASPARFPNTAEKSDTETLYTIYLKDNDEFDNDYISDSDELVIAVVSSAGQEETRTTIEAGFLFDAEALSPYKQYGQSAGRKSATTEAGEISMVRRL